MFVFRRQTFYSFFKTWQDEYRSKYETHCRVASKTSLCDPVPYELVGFPNCIMTSLTCFPHVSSREFFYRISPICNLEFDRHYCSGSRLIVGFFVLLKFSLTTKIYAHTVHTLHAFGLRELIIWYLDSTSFCYINMYRCDVCNNWHKFPAVYLITTLVQTSLLCQMISCVQKE